MTFTITATGSEPLSYGWLFENFLLSDGGQISGTTNSSLTITNLAAGNAGWYQAIVTDSTGSVTSAPAALTVNLATLDGGFAPWPNGFVASLAIQPDGKLVVGGYFSNIGGQPRNDLARFDSNGSLDTGFNPSVTGSVEVVTLQSDGKLIVGGVFTSIAGQSRTNIARLNPDGTIDSSFNSSAGYQIHAVAVQADGKIVVGGRFTTLAGQSRPYLGRLNPDGSLDAEFTPTTGGTSQPNIYNIALQPGGKILVAGNFTTLNGQPRLFLGRLNPDGSLDENFVPPPNSGVSAIALHPDGHIIVGGTFTNLVANQTVGLVRLNTNGTPTWHVVAATDSRVRSITLQADGDILIGGSFTNVAGQIRNRLAKFKGNGGLDLNFDPGIGAYGSPLVTTVDALAVQPNGEILVGGAFPSIAGQPRSQLARLHNQVSATETLTHTNGNLIWLRNGSSPEIWQANFELSANDLVWSQLGEASRIPGGWQLTNVVLPPNASVRARGRIASDNLTAGWYSQQIIGSPALQSHPANRTNQAGTLAIFSATAAGSEMLNYQWLKNGDVVTNSSTVAGATTSFLSLSNVLGGDAGNYSVWVTNSFGSRTSLIAVLTVIDPIITANPTNQHRNAGQSVTFLVSAVGTAPVFQWQKNNLALPQATNSSLTLTNLQAADAGAYRVVVSNSYGSLTSSVANLTVNLALLDANFVANANGPIYGLALQSDGKILIGGSFTTLTNQGGTPQLRNRIARLNADGSLDENFQPEASNTVHSVTVQTDGKIIAGGVFTSLGGQTRNRIGRLNANGTIDSNFLATANNTVYVTAIQTNNKILVGGAFTTLNNQSRFYLGRLNADGTLDTTFNPGAAGQVRSIALQPDGKILIGDTEGLIRRLNENGNNDPGFAAAANDDVYSLLVQTNGQILVGGRFTSLANQSRSWIGRLNTNGTCDLSFNPGASGAGSDVPGIYTLALQTDGKILVGGGFFTLGGNSNLRYLGRLNPNGSIDTGFNPLASSSNPNFSSTVYALALDHSGQVITGGEFTLLGGTPRSRLGRLANTSPALESLTHDGTNAVWLRSGAGPEIRQTSFAFSTNSTAWIELGVGNRISGGWQIPSASIPINGVLRARGFTTGGQGNGSSWFTETFAPIAGQPIIGTLGVTNGILGFNLFTVPGQLVSVEASTNLTDWSVILAITNDAGLMFFGDANLTNFPSRFYRIRAN